MGAEKTFIEQARRKQIVAAAIDVISEDGFKAASVARIAERANISKSLVLYHFKNKDELLRQTLFDTIGMLSQQVTKDIDFTASAVEVLPQLVHRSAQIGVQYARSRRAVDQIIANLGHPAQGKPTLSPLDAEPLIAGIEQLFIAGKTQGVFRADLNTRIMAITYQSAIEAMHRHFDIHPEADITEYADELVDILLRGAQAGTIA